MKMKLKASVGFTLVELLVVISIIGLLSSVILSSLNSARKKARDAVRQAGIKQLGIALEVYYQTHEAYPSCGGDWTGRVASYDCMMNALITDNLVSVIVQDPQYPGPSCVDSSCPRYHYDNFCQLPSLYDNQHFRLWAGTETPKGGLPLWWSDYAVGQTNCVDPS
jgi:prepilin-type N-terminal cleavage/methylation domain-containing protein